MPSDDLSKEYLTPDELGVESPSAEPNELVERESTSKNAGLEDLINQLVEAHGARICLNIEDRLPPQSRPRVILAAAQSVDRDEPLLDEEAVAAALRALFLIYTPPEAIARSCSLRELRKLCKDLTGADEFDRYADIRSVAKAILDRFGLPYPTEYDVLPLLSASEAIRHIGEMESRLMKGLDQALLEGNSMQGSIIGAWSIVEGVLKLSLGFYLLHFESQLPREYVSRCKRALVRGGGGQIVNLLQELQIIFDQGELKREKRARETELQDELRDLNSASRRRTEERDSLVRRLDELKGLMSKPNLDQSTVELLRREYEWVQDRIQQIAIKEKSERRRKKTLLEAKAREDKRKQQEAERLRRSCYRDFGRANPFEAVKPEDYRDLFRLHRNRFAHQPILGTLKEETLSETLDSLRSARQIVQHLRKEQIIPRIVVVLGQGRDWYGNPAVWFVDRSRISEQTSNKRTMEWMYVDHNMRLAPFQCIAMIAPTAAPKLKEPLIDPIFYPIESIIAMLWN